MSEYERYSELLADYRQLQDRHKKLLRSKRKKMQFSQKICVFGLFLITSVVVANFFLIWFGREPMNDVATISITVFGGFATGGYFMLSGARDCSKNKHGVRED
jgi:hypothetical protein